MKHITKSLTVTDYSRTQVYEIGVNGVTNITRKTTDDEGLHYTIVRDIGDIRTITKLIGVYQFEELNKYKINIKI